MIGCRWTAIVATLTVTALASCGGGDRSADTDPSVGSTTTVAAASTDLEIDAVVLTVLQDWYGSGEIGGAVAAIGLADGGVHVAATGDAAPGQAAQGDDNMRVGSITKTFIATLTLRLHDTGVLDIDDPVADYLPDLGIDDTITIRSLLAHTSGVADPDPTQLITSIRADPAQRFELAELLDMADIPDGTDPRPQSFAYANAGYHLLGAVIESATGTSVAEVLRCEVLEPAELAGTFLAGAEEAPTVIVPGNVDLDGDGREDSLNAIPYLAVESAAWTAGALVSTPTDMIQFARALFHGSIISDHTLDRMTETSTEAHGHGLGIFDIGLDAAIVYGHSGGGPGFHANFAHHPALGTTAVVFTNCPSCAAGGIDTWQLLVDLLAIAEEAT